MVGAGSRCGRPCRTRRTSAACRDPACPRTCGRRTCGIASAHRPYSVCKRARSSLNPGKQGDGISSGRAPPCHPAPHHTHSTEGFYSVCRRACSSLMWGGVGCQLRHDPHPCTHPQPSTEGLDQNSLLIGFSTMGFPSPGRSILKTSSTKTIRQSLRESPLQENGPVRTTSGQSQRRPQNTRPLGHVLTAHE